MYNERELLVKSWSKLDADAFGDNDTNFLGRCRLFGILISFWMQVKGPAIALDILNI